MSAGSLQVGEQFKLNRPTFLHNGIFVFQGCTVTVKSVEDSTVTVEFIDREGFPHLLAEVSPDELER